MLELIKALAFSVFFPWRIPPLTRYAAWFCPWSITPMIVAAAAAAVFSFRWFRSGTRVLSKTMATLLGVTSPCVCWVQIQMYVPMREYAKWKSWFDSGCGIKSGMTHDEVISTLKSRADVDQAIDDRTYFIRTRGLEALQLKPPGEFRPGGERPGVGQREPAVPAAGIAKRVLRSSIRANLALLIQGVFETRDAVAGRV